MLRIFSANHVYNFLLIPIFGILLLLGSILNPAVFPPEACLHTTPACSFLYNSNIPYWGAVLINLGFTLIICFLLQQINARFTFIRVRSFLPSYLFLFLVYVIPDLHTIQPVFIAAVFMLLAIRSIFASFEQKEGISNAFNASFFIGIASIFYLHIILLTFLVPIGIFIIRSKIGWHEFAASLMGLLLPWIYTFSVYYIWFDSNDLLSFLHNSFIQVKSPMDYNYFLFAFFGFLILVTILASVFIMKQYDEKKISSRRYFKILLFFFTSSLLLLIFHAVSYEIIVLLAIPLTYLIANYLIFMRRRFWAEIFFITMGVMAFVFQYFLK